MVDKIRILNETRNQLITKESLDFIVQLHKRFNQKRLELLKERIVIQSKINSNAFKLERDAKSFEIRNDSSWRVGEIPELLRNRKVDIVCLDVANKKTLIECLKSGANGIQVDFDDGYSPSWSNNLQSQLNLYEIVHDGKYSGKECPLLLMRPRSLNLDEFHLLVNGQSLSGAFFDLGLYLFWNGKTLLEQKRGPFFYLPKLENYQEALLYRDILAFCEDYLKFPSGSIKVIVLIENILASYQMEEMIYALKDNIVALNTGRWDYIFSFVKKFSASSEYILPAKSSLGLDQPFLESYYRLVVSISHKRGCLATGGMSPQYPSNGRLELTEKEKLTVYNGKKTEALMGFDGALVAHASAVEQCRKAFDSVIGQQLDNSQCQGVKQSKITYGFDPVLNQKYFNMLSIAPKGFPVCENDVKDCVYALYKYIYYWIQGKGAVEMNGIIEDLASIEINRALLWKWLSESVILKEGIPFTFKCLLIHFQNLEKEFNPLNINHQQIQFLIELFLTSRDFIDFMPTVLYPILCQNSIKLTSSL
ncbi:malate synthase [Tieghemostelium lacteum]|uniref:malate synthase n=1 Tax=Tieghemostelium lacteum TaxID=361077 RepID=A0A152A4V4_TIELA|nr:malate synthase [Tieghemostelium lacteum]|eukprot:KYR01269.1 malate synthase [Tieghemostelium lacteum]